jgi:hypothetical protein
VLSSVERNIGTMLSSVQRPTRTVSPRSRPSAVDNSAHTIELGTAHGLKTGDAVLYRAGGGTPINGLTDGTTYFAIVDPGAPTKLRLASSHQAATAGQAIAITRTGATGNQHRLLINAAGAGGGSIANAAVAETKSNSPAGRVSAATSGTVGVGSGTTAAIDGGATVTARSVGVHARQKLVDAALTGGIGGGLIALGLGIAVVDVEADVSAYVGPSATVTAIGAGGRLTVGAQLDETVRVLGFAAAAAGYISLGSAVAVVKSRGDVRALLGARVAPGGDIVSGSAAGSAVVAGTGFGAVTVKADASRTLRLATGAVAIAAGAGSAPPSAWRSPPDAPRR